MSPTTGSKALIREINQALVLDAVRRRGLAARSEIVRDTGLSAATITGISAHLVASGLLNERRTSSEHPGRPARQLELNRETVFASGVQVSSDGIEAVVIDLCGEVRGEHRASLASMEPDEVADAAVRAVHAAFDVPESARMVGTGVAISGVVDSDTGVIRHSGALGWTDVSLSELIARRTSGHVMVDNLVNCYAASRLADEPTLTDEAVLILSVGTSIGASFVTSGAVQRGHLGSAGGFAHSHTVDGGDGRSCHCGDVDCLESWSSGWGMLRALARGDGATERTVRADAGRQLGAAAANAAKLLGPHRLIVAVFPELHHEEFLESARATFADRFRHAMTPAPLFETARADGGDIARGAAYAILSTLFAPSASR